MDKADRVCNLECVDKKKALGRHEFVGPVKIVLVESSSVDYNRKVWGAAVLTLAMLLMGATVFTVFFFTLKFNLPFTMNVHVFLCTIGYQLFMTTGILMFSSLFGGSTHLKPSHRKFQHLLLEIFGGLTGVLGTFFALGSMTNTLHAFSGFSATVLYIITCLTGPAAYSARLEGIFGQFCKRAHLFLALPTFILCTICFTLGLAKESFINWAPINNLHIILIIFTIFYSLACVVSIYLRAKYAN